MLELVGEADESDGGAVLVRGMVVAGVEGDVEGVAETPVPRTCLLR